MAYGTSHVGHSRYTSRHLKMRWRPQKVRRLFDAKAWTELPFSLWACYLFVSLCGLYLPSFYIQIYGVRFMDADLASYLLPALNAGSFFGRLVSKPLNSYECKVIEAH